MTSSRGPKKSLGQHWLKDPEILADIAEAAELTSDDVVLEIGPGLDHFANLGKPEKAYLY